MTTVGTTADGRLQAGESPLGQCSSGVGEVDRLGEKYAARRRADPDASAASVSRGPPAFAIEAPEWDG